MTPARPALAGSLAVMCDGPDVAQWSALLADPQATLVVCYDGVTCDRGGSAVAVARWSYDHVRQVLEAVVARDLAPIHWLDPSLSPGWPCVVCRDTGRVPDAWTEAQEGCLCGRRGDDTPFTTRELLSVVSLGLDTIHRTEQIVAETWSGARTLWKCADREEIERHHKANRDERVGRRRARLSPADPAEAFSLAEPMLKATRGEWDAEAAFWDAPETRRAWPAIRAIAALSLDLLDVPRDDGGRTLRASIGVESLGPAPAGDP